MRANTQTLLSRPLAKIHPFHVDAPQADTLSTPVHAHTCKCAKTRITTGLTRTHTHTHSHVRAHTHTHAVTMAEAVKSFDDWIVNHVKEYWYIPCTKVVPEPVHGICIQIPAMSVFAVILGTIYVLKQFETKKKKE